VVGLVAIVWRGMQTASVVGGALDSGLGSGWRAAIDAKIAARLRSRLTVRALLGPLFVRRRGVEHVSNLRYGDAGESNLLDLYRHRSRPADRPVLIHFHGGALTGGKKDHDALPLLYRLASQGWVCISANYRLSPAATFPDHLIDAKKVIAWARTHGLAYGADPTTVFVAGGSSGAQLAALAALTANDAELQPGFETANTTVSAAITLYGDYDWLDAAGAWSALGIDRTGSQQPIMKSSPVENREAWLQASPLAHIRQDAPPFFVVHGDRDTALPVAAARHFAHQLRGVSQRPVVYAELPGALHNFDLFQSPRGEAVIRGIEAFATWVRANARQSSSDLPQGHAGNEPRSGTCRERRDAPPPVARAATRKGRAVRADECRARLGSGRVDRRYRPLGGGSARRGIITRRPAARRADERCGRGQA
jgi:acetyl esterase/lipase